MAIKKRYHTNKKGQKIASWGYDFYDIFGKRHQKSGFKTKPDAEKAQSEDMQNSNAGANSSKNVNIKFKDIVEKFIALYVEINLKPSTIRSYHDHYRLHIKDFFLDIKLVEINTMILLRFIKTKKKEGLSNKTINNILTTIGTIFNWAIENGYTNYNPAQRVKKLKVENLEMNFLTSSEITAVLEYAQMNYPDFYPLLLTAIYSGMRRGEILALTWDCVNFKECKIKVRKTLYKGQFLTPKTKNSIRDIRVPQKIIEVLKLHKSMQEFENPLNLVFSQENGKPIDADNMVKRRFNKVLKGANVTQIRFHDLRHTYASLLLAKDMNIKYIQKQMGHANFEITMNTYAHLMPEVYISSEDIVFRTLLKSVFEMFNRCVWLGV